MWPFVNGTDVADHHCQIQMQGFSPAREKFGNFVRRYIFGIRLYWRHFTKSQDSAVAVLSFQPLNCRSGQPWLAIVRLFAIKRAREPAGVFVLVLVRMQFKGAEDGG